MAKFRRQGCVKISYEMLANMLGMEIGSIDLLDTDPRANFLYIFHSDEDVGVFDLPEGCVVPEASVDALNLPRLLCQCGKRKRYTDEETDEQLSLDFSDNKKSTGE